MGGTFAFTTPGTAPAAGTTAQGVTFTPTNTANYSTVSGSVSVTVNPLPAVLTGSRLYDGTVEAAAAILTVSNALAGDTVTVVSGKATLAGALPGVRAITSMGTLVLGGARGTNYTLTGASGWVTITSSGPPRIIIQPAGGVVGIGQSNSVSVAAVGAGPLVYQWFKDGVLLAGQSNSSVSFASFQFTNSGSYRVVVTNSLGLVISMSGLLSVPNVPLQAWGRNDKGQLGNGSNGAVNQPVSVVSNVVAVAAGASHSLLVKADGTLWAMGGNSYGQLGNGSNGDTNLPVNLVGLSVASPGAMVQAYHSLAVAAMPISLATVTLTKLAQTYDGTAKPVTVVTSPANLAVSVTYNGSANAPTNAGNYTVVGTVTDLNYYGGATNTLVIAAAAATVTLSNLSQIYDATAKSVTVTTAPANLAVRVTYNGSASAPTNAGSYTVIAFVTDPNYRGTNTVTCQIMPKPLNITANADSKVCGQTRTYGPGQRAFSPGAGELVNGDTVASVTLACPDGGPASALVGSYHIIASAAVGSGLGNYSISYHDGVLTVQPINPVTTPVTTGIKNNGDGIVTVSFSGTPNVEYVVQASGDLFAPVWENVSTNVAGADGRWTFEDSTALQRQRYYRSANP